MLQQVFGTGSYRFQSDIEMPLGIDLPPLLKRVLLLIDLVVESLCLVRRNPGPVDYQTTMGAGFPETIPLARLVSNLHEIRGQYFVSTIEQASFVSAFSASRFAIHPESP
jgi:hypothetical protein